MKWLFLSGLLFISPALADEPKAVTVDMTIPLLDQDEHPILDQFDAIPDPVTKQPDCSKCRPLTLGAAVAHALFFVNPDERDVTGEQKWAWSALAMQLRNDKAAKIDHAQGDLIYKRLGRLYSGVILMRAMPLIDPNRAVPEIK